MAPTTQYTCTRVATPHSKYYSVIGTALYSVAQQSAVVEVNRPSSVERGVAM